MPVHFYDLIGQVYITLTLWVFPDWRRRVLAFGIMFAGDKSYSVAMKLERFGGPLEGFADFLWVQGGSTMALLLLLLFGYWYWRDYRADTEVDGPPSALSPEGPDSSRV
jgi:hypothetical protein